MTNQTKGNQMNDKKITLNDWSSVYLGAFETDEKLQKSIDDYGGFAGWISDGVSSLNDIDGEEATDHECMEYAYQLLELYFDACKRGMDTQ